jgi:hypothetical protein
MTERAIVDPDSPRWAALLERVRHDFYHLPAYVRSSARFDGGEPRAVLVEDGGRSLLVPMIVRRPIPGAESDARWDAISPYGYPGVLVEAPEAERESFASSALEIAQGVLRDQGCVSLFVRLHPVLGPVPRPAGATVVHHGETVAIDLRRTDEELWRETMSGHRNEINRSIRAGHRAFVDREFVHAARFVEIYHATMRRVSASAYYFFSMEYLDAMREALGDRLALIIVEIGGAVAAGGLFVVTGDIAQYHLSGVDDAFVRDRPTKLMLHFARGWARDRGASVLHLGGGVGGAKDSLFAFKAGFSRGRCPFHTLRMVVDPEAYESIARARGVTASLDDLSGFFPAYRAPPKA